MFVIQFTPFESNVHLKVVIVVTRWLDGYSLLFGKKERSGRCERTFDTQFFFAVKPQHNLT